MSKIIEFEASGKKDLCAIEPEEIVRFCIDHNVDRINSMINMWKFQKIIDEEKIEEMGFSDELEERRVDGWDIIPTNIWSFDIN